MYISRTELIVHDGGKKKIEGERGNEHSKNRKVFNEIFAATGKMESVTSE